MTSMWIPLYINYSPFMIMKIIALSEHIGWILTVLPLFLDHADLEPRNSVDKVTASNKHAKIQLYIFNSKKKNRIHTYYPPSLQ